MFKLLLTVNIVVLGWLVYTLNDIENIVFNGTVDAVEARLALICKPND